MFLNFKWEMQSSKQYIPALALNLIMSQLFMVAGYSGISYLGSRRPHRVPVSNSFPPYYGK